MRAELKRLYSPDVDDLESHIPDDPDRFCFLLQAFFGPADEPGEESFDMVVCTPRWLNEVDYHGPIFSARHHLIVKQYDFVMIRAFVLSFAARCTGETWQDIAMKLSRLGRWEFEDYDPATLP